MHLQIFPARTDVEPFSPLGHDPADLSAVADPFPQKWDKGDALPGGNPLENGRGPNGDAGEIVTPGVAVAIFNVDDPAAVERDIFPQAGLPQGKRHVVSGARVLVEQRPELDVRKNIAAVNDERFVAQQRLDILDPTASSQNLRLVSEVHLATAILLLGKELPKRIRPMVSIDYERFHSRVDQVIEDKRDQWFLENRDQRLGNVFGERTKPRPEPGAENKCLRNHQRAMLVLCRSFDKTGLMAEETIWRGTASQLKNLGCFILCFLFCWLIVPIFIGLRRYLETKNQVFELTTERLKMTQGIFSKVTETLELYRVKDIEVLQPFIYRIVGLENIKVNTSDLSSPVILLDGISQKVVFADKLRNQVEIIRAQKKVRELDIE